MKAFLITVVLVASACAESGGPSESDADAISSRIELFLSKQGILEPGSAATILARRPPDLTLFRVNLGADLPAHGLALGGHIGWVEIPAGLPGGAVLDLSAGDAVAIAENLLRPAIVDRAALDALRLLLARDLDTPVSVLIEVAGSLHDIDRSDRAPAIAATMLDHPAVRGSVELLRSLVLASHLDSAWQPIHDRAWQFLRSAQPPLDRLEITAEVERSGDQLSALIDFRNRAAEPIWIEHAQGCQVAILVFPATGITGEPLWDGLDWRNGQVGGCKIPSSITGIEPGQGMGLIAPLVTDETILGDSIPPGEYMVAVRARVTQPRDTTLVVIAGTMALDATLARELSAPIQTDRLRYELAQTELAWETTIPFTFRNQSPGIAYLAHCQGSYFLELEKLVNGSWVLGWAPVVPLCLSLEPIQVASGGIFQDSIPVIAGRPGTNLAPKFEVPDPEGMYRIVIHALSSYDSHTFPFGPELPLSQRISNPFRIVIAAD